MEILAAARFARKILPKDVKIFSAGLEPKGIHPMVTKVMQEVGIDISHQKSKNIPEIPINKIDLVVTLFGMLLNGVLFSLEKLKEFIGQKKILLRSRTVKRRLPKYFGGFRIKLNLL